MAWQVENWLPCPPIPGCITINIGDPLQIWSDGVLKSNYHRVRWPKEGEPQVPELAPCLDPVDPASAAFESCQAHSTTKRRTDWVAVEAKPPSASVPL